MHFWVYQTEYWTSFKLIRVQYDSFSFSMFQNCYVSIGWYPLFGLIGSRLTGTGMVENYHIIMPTGLRCQVTITTWLLINSKAWIWGFYFVGSIDKKFWREVNSIIMTEASYSSVFYSNQIRKQWEKRLLCSGILINSLRINSPELGAYQCRKKVTRLMADANCFITTWNVGHHEDQAKLGNQ